MTTGGPHRLPARDLSALRTIPDIVLAARERLTDEVWDYGCGGAESEVTLRRNRAAFQHVAFRPHVLQDVSAVDTSCAFLGHRLALPVMVAPVGSVALFDPGGAAAAAGAAHRAGTAAFTGCLSEPALEQTRAAGSGPLFFQLYRMGDRAWLRELALRAQDAGFDGLCLTVDSPVYGRRERDLRHGFSRSGTQERPNLAGMVPADLSALAQLTWDDVEWLAGLTALPLIVKGIQRADDAARAVAAGASVVYVSNHGGRQLDHAPASLDVLGEVAGACGGAEVVVDSGFLRGTDVVKALCLGARAVLVGRLACWGLAAGGAAGAARALTLLQEEIAACMAMLGARRVEDLGPDLLVGAVPPPADVWPVTTTDPSRA